MSIMVATLVMSGMVLRYPVHSGRSIGVQGGVGGVRAWVPSLLESSPVLSIHGGSGLWVVYSPCRFQFRGRQVQISFSVG